MIKIRKELISAINDFIFIGGEPQKADCIFVPGGSNAAPALLAAKLFNNGFAPLLIPSGKGPLGIGHFSGDKSRGSFATECDFYCSIFASEGVPYSSILQEEEAQYTKENALFTRRLCDAKKIYPRRALLACKSYHSRRAYTYYSISFPDTEIIPVTVEIPGRGVNDWYLTDKGIDRICGEVDRMAGQFNDFLKAGNKKAKGHNI